MMAMMVAMPDKRTPRRGMIMADMVIATGYARKEVFYERKNCDAYGYSGNDGSDKRKEVSYMRGRIMATMLAMVTMLTMAIMLAMAMIPAMGTTDAMTMDMVAPAIKIITLTMGIVVMYMDMVVMDLGTIAMVTRNMDIMEDCVTYIFRYL